MKRIKLFEQFIQPELSNESSSASDFYYFHRDLNKKYGDKQLSALKKFMKGKFEISPTSEGQIYAKLTANELEEVKKYLADNRAEAVLIKKLEGEYF